MKLYVLYAVGIILHEALHAFGFLVFGKAEWDEVKFGFLKKYLVPYVHCTIPLPIRAYRIALLISVIATGLLPFIIGMVIGKGILVCAAVLLTTGGVGDWLIFQRLRSFTNESRVEDHPNEIGCIVYEG